MRQVNCGLQYLVNNRSSTAHTHTHTAHTHRVHLVDYLHDFLSRYTEEEEWKKEDEGWEGIVDENEHYTEDEYKDWEDEYYDYGNSYHGIVYWCYNVFVR